MENVCVPLYFVKGSIKEMRNKAKEVLFQVGIENLSKRTVGKLSGGQMQRVVTARALVNDPGIILADEPTGALDSNTSQEIMSLLIELNKKGKTVIITHDMLIAKQCNRIIKIEDGVLV